MTHDTDHALKIAQRIADGETVDILPSADDDPALMRGLGRLGALARAMRPMGSPGVSWGHLQQLVLAGKGGFGEVYRAYDPTLDRIVALKLRREDGPVVVTGSRDFVAEARRLARVRHAHVLAVHGASYHDGRAGLWADWIDGETLSTRIAHDGAMTGLPLLRVLLELADALAAVHEAGLVHGDIKASNVMLDRKGRVILMDFGAGFEPGNAGNMINAGTPRYLAPEVIAGKPANCAMDLYAFGVLAHFIASGAFPNEGVNHDSRLPSALRKLIHRLLDPDPEKRPQAGQLRHELQGLIDAPSLRTRRWLRTSIMFGLVAVAVSTAVGLRREQAQRKLAEAEREAATRAYTDARRVNDFLAMRIQQGTPTSQQDGVALTFKQWVLNSIDLLEPELGDVPRARAMLRHGFAASLLEQGDPAAAAVLAAQAVADMRNAFGASEYTASALATEAMALNGLAQHDRAQALLDECLAMLATLPETEAVRKTRTSARTTLLRVANARGDYGTALRIGQANIAERTALFGADSFRVAVDYNNLAMTLQRLGRLAESETALQRARDLLNRDPNKSSARLAALDVSLCQLQLERGLVQSARDNCARAVTLAEQALGPRHPQTLAHRNALAAVLLFEGDFSHADAESQRVVTALRAQHLPVADALQMRARVKVQQRQWTEALAMARESAQMATANGVASGINLDRPNCILALAQHMLAPTSATLRALNARAGATFDNPDYPPSSRAYAAALLFIGLQQSGRFEEAQHLREQAVELMATAMDRPTAEARWLLWVADPSR